MLKKLEHRENLELRIYNAELWQKLIRFLLK